jgi:predicted SAM-dependent methyltransferase
MVVAEKKATSTSLKSTRDGRVMFNIGCGARMNREWNNVDFSYLARLRRRMRAARALHRIKVLSDERWNRLALIDPEIIVHDLRKGIPAPDDSVDVVYHSQVLEHIDRDVAPRFLRECLRVLKPGGVLRVVVPDLERAARDYLGAIDDLDAGRRESLDRLNATTEFIFEQMVRRSNYGTGKQPPLVQVIERMVRGDAHRDGEAHRWMYDRYSLGELLLRVGFRDPIQQQPQTSLIEDWVSFDLDTDRDGTVYNPGSLIMEATKGDTP